MDPFATMNDRLRHEWADGYAKGRAAGMEDAAKLAERAPDLQDGKNIAWAIREEARSRAQVSPATEEKTDGPA